MNIKPLSILAISLLWVPMHAVCPVPGTGIVVNGTTATESGCIVTAAETPGLQANLAGTITLSNGSVTSTGGGGYGAYANGPGTLINLVNVALSTSSANTLFLNSGEILFNTGSVLASGASTNGAQLLGTNALLTMGNVNVQATGTSGVGVFVQLGDNTANISNSTITTTANGGRGVDVGLGSGAASSATLTNCIINTAQGIGPPSFGSVVARNGSSVSVTDSSINTEVNGVHSTTSGASITVDNTNINVTATAGVFGAYAQNDTTITLQNNTSITTTGGNNAHGFVIQDGSTGNIFDSSIETSGTNAQGLFMIGFSDGNQANISDSTIATTGINASAITTFGNVGITNTIQAENTTFSAANVDVIGIAGGITNIDFTNVTAHASDPHRLLLVDGANPATLNLTANTSSLYGDMEVLSGNIGNVILNNTTWTGGALNLTNLTANAGSWNLNVNSSITNQLINNGLIDFVSEGNTFKTLTVSGGYISQNGTMGLNTFLGSDNSPSDRLILNGSPATGNTFLNIKNTTGLGDITTGSGILVIDAINGGTTSAGTFSLANDVIAGPYEYTLFRGSSDATGPENWYLRSTMTPPTPPVPPIPHYREEVSLYAALPSTALLYGRTLLDTLHQRVGDAFQTCGQEETSFFKNLWTRVIARDGKQNGHNIFHHGPEFKYNLLAFQGGIDVYTRTGENGNRDHVGVLGAMGRGRSTVRHFTDIKAGRNKFDAYTMGAYWTHLDSCGWYIDNVFESTWYRNVKAKSRRIPSLKTHGMEWDGSIEAGYAFQYNGIIVEPQAQIVYQSLRLDDSRDIASTVDFNRTHSVLGRVGLRLANTWSFDCLPAVTGWARADVWNDFNGKSRLFFSSESGPVSIASDIGGSWFEGTVGLTAQLTDTLSFYSSFTGNVYFNGRGHAYNGIAGLKAEF